MKQHKTIEVSNLYNKKKTLKHLDIEDRDSSRSVIVGNKMKDIGEIDEDFSSENISDSSTVRSFKSNLRRITGQVGQDSDGEDVMMTDEEFMSSNERTVRTTREVPESVDYSKFTDTKDPRKERT